MHLYTARPERPDGSGDLRDQVMHARRVLAEEIRSQRRITPARDQIGMERIYVVPGAAR